MDPISGLATGFAAIASPSVFIALVAGVILGSVVGVLPGLGPLGAVAILMPLSFTMDTTAAIAMLAAIYYGAQYGGSTTSILLNIPGEVTSVVTTVDGYQMTKRGRAGAALTVAAVGSFVAGTISIVLLMLFTPLLAGFAISFAPPEFLALTVFGVTVLSRLFGGSLALTFLLVAIGLGLKTVGLDSLFGVNRFAFGNMTLVQGLELTAVAIGLFGIGEVLATVSEPKGAKFTIPSVRWRELLPTRGEARRSWAPMLRGTGVGFVAGLMPGPAGVVSTWTSYAVEKRLSRQPEQFGHGAIEGVAGPESANNAAAGATLVPLLALGVPFGALTALLLGAFMLHGIMPGPLLLKEHPETFWGLVASMYAGNVMLLILNLPLVGLFVNILRVPRDILLMMILILSLVGTYTVNNSLFDVSVALAFGLLAYAMRQFGLSPMTLVLPMVIATIMEKSLVQTLLLAKGEPIAYLLDRPIAVALLVTGLAAFVLPVVWRFGRSRYVQVPRRSEAETVKAGES